MSERLTKIIALVICSVNVLLIGLYSGYSMRFSEDSFFISGGNGYEFLASCYIYICLLLLVFFLGRVVKNKVLSNTIYISSLVLTFFLYRLIYLQKSLYYNNGLPLNQLLQISTPLDWISFLLVLILIVIQIITISQQYFDWKHKSAKIK